MRQLFVGSVGIGLCRSTQSTNKSHLATSNDAYPSALRPLMLRGAEFQHSKNICGSSGADYALVSEQLNDRRKEKINHDQNQKCKPWIRSFKSILHSQPLLPLENSPAINEEPSAHFTQPHYRHLFCFPGPQRAGANGEH